MGLVYFLIVLVAIAIDIAFAMYAGGIAEQKGYSKGNWIAVCIIFGIFGYILIAALPDLELRAALENIEKKLAKDKNDNYLPRSSSSSNSNCTIKSLSEMTPLADYWTCKYCGLDNPKEARYCQHCGGYR
jgi:MFS-type transporter involved in bile tolerance (Atg22 family)